MGDVAQCLNGPVTAGDLVRVVLPASCCGSRKDVGQVFRVLGFEDRLGQCCECGVVSRSRDAIYTGDALGQPVAGLIRIDPPALLESVEDVAMVPA